MAPIPVKKSNEQNNTKSNEELTLVELDHVLDLTGGKPIFSKKRVKQVADFLERYHSTGDIIFKFSTIDRKVITAKLWNEIPKLAILQNNRPELLLRWRNYQEMAVETITQHKSAYLPIVPIARTHPPFNCGKIKDHPLMDSVQTLMERWDKEWLESEFYMNLHCHLEDNAKVLEGVTQIVCFGLGRVTDKRAYTQHLAALEIKHTLAATDHKGVRPHPITIPVFAQDPAYCEWCKKWLESEDITFLEDPWGFLEIDAGTFVISFSPNAPVRQIVADITHDFGGPLAMLCDSINDDGMEFDGTLFDPRLDIRERRKLGQYVTEADPDSPNLFAYKQRCKVLELDDLYNVTQEHPWGMFGNTELYVRADLDGEKDCSVKTEKDSSVQTNGSLVKSGTSDNPHEIPDEAVKNSPGAVQQQPNQTLKTYVSALASIIQQSEKIGTSINPHEVVDKAVKNFPGAVEQQRTWDEYLSAFDSTIQQSEQMHTSLLALRQAVPRLRQAIQGNNVEEETSQLTAEPSLKTDHRNGYE